MIFVDTSFFIAVGNARDAHHAEATHLLGRHGRSGLVTSNLVRGESWTFINRRYGHRAAVGFLDRLDGSNKLEVLRVNQDVEDQALRWLRRHDEREYSFVDATSFALMRSLTIREALTFDGDFAAAGFVALRM
jgi:predicted nucleic acid-binding protein